MVSSVPVKTTVLAVTGEPLVAGASTPQCHVTDCKQTY
jgi:hypothetical protein